MQNYFRFSDKLNKVEKLVCYNLRKLDASCLYSFTADTPGTHYYHAHIGMQRGDGIAGALVVKRRTPRYPDVHDLSEHTIMVQDWFHETSLQFLMIHLYTGGAPFPSSIIANGMWELFSHL